MNSNEKPKSFIPKIAYGHRVEIRNRTGLRRSKSFSDLGRVVQSFTKSFRPIPEEAYGVQTAVARTATTKATKAKSVTNVNAASSGSGGKLNNNRNALIAVKRPLVNEDKTNLAKRPKQEAKKVLAKENKPAAIPPARPPKPASYDYKARYNLLNEKHTILRTAQADLKTQLSQVCCENDCLKKDNELLSEKVRTMENDRDRLKLLEINYSLLENEKQDLEKKNASLNKDLMELRGAYDILKEELNINLTTLKSTQNDLSEYREKFECTRVELQDCKTTLTASEAVRRELHNTVQNMKGNIRVFCRVRPPLSTECDKILCNMNYMDEETLELKGRDNQISEFTFDKVFQPEATQLEVFEEIAGLVQSALDGYHVCVFAYGQTGSGKTYTMQGETTNSALGMIPRSMDLLFESIDRLQKVGWVYTVEASFLEIYNEAIRDLLDQERKQHEIRFNEGKGITVTNLKVETIVSSEEFKHLMQLAGRYRAVAATKSNEHSSRSHAVTKIYIRGVNKESKVTYTGSLNLIDLAGSESAKTSSDERLPETKNINRSLSALGNVILALHKKESHVPFRNSKLTYMLQSSLAGNSKTLMIVNVSPFEECYNETINSLRFAFKVKSVKVNSKRNKTYTVMQDKTF